MLLRLALRFSFSLLVVLAATGDDSSQTVNFHDDALGFTYSYPASFEEKPGAQKTLDEIKQGTGDSGLKQTVSCIRIPLRLKGKTEQPYERLLLVETNYDCMQKSLPPHYVEHFARLSMMSLMGVYGEIKLDQPQTYDLDGHEAAFISGKAEASSIRPDMTLYAAQSCARVTHTMVCWNILSSDKTRLPILLAGQIRFDESSNQRLFPAQLIPN